MRLALAAVLLVAVAACSDSVAEPVTTTTTTTTAPDPCLDIPGSAWQSLRLLLGGETPGGGTTQEHWILVFTDTEVEWWHTDVVAIHSYSCDSQTMTAGEEWRDINPEFVLGDDGGVLIRWAGELYEQVDSPFE